MKSLNVKNCPVNRTNGENKWEEKSGESSEKWHVASGKSVSGKQVTSYQMSKQQVTMAVQLLNTRYLVVLGSSGRAGPVRASRKNTGTTTAL